MRKRSQSGHSLLYVYKVLFEKVNQQNFEFLDDATSYCAGINCSNGALSIRLHKPTAVNCVFSIVLVARLSGIGDLTQCTRAHDMSNRLIERSGI